MRNLRSALYPVDVQRKALKNDLFLEISSSFNLFSRIPQHDDELIMDTQQTVMQCREAQSD